MKKARFIAFVTAVSVTTGVAGPKAAKYLLLTGDDRVSAVALVVESDSDVPAVAAAEADELPPAAEAATDGASADGDAS